MADASARLGDNENTTDPHTSTFDAYMEVMKPVGTMLKLAAPMSYKGWSGRLQAGKHDLQSRMYSWFHSFDVIEHAGALCQSSQGWAWLGVKMSVGAYAPVAFVTRDSGSPRSAYFNETVALGMCRVAGCWTNDFDVLFSMLTGDDPKAEFSFYYIVGPADSKRF